MSPHHNKAARVRGRSRDNDMSSTNIKSALDQSTLEILKNMSNKKERDVSNSCQMLNKGNQFQNNQVKNEDTCVDNNKSQINKSQINTS